MPVYLYEVEHKKYNIIQELAIEILSLAIGNEDQEVEALCREQVSKLNAEKKAQYGDSGGDWFEFLWVKCLHSDCAGIDPYGRYYNMTGYECPDKCFWCGESTPRTRRYCKNRKCRKEYVRHYRWQEARNWCRDRYETKCGECNKDEDTKYDSSLRFAAHHIKPLRGSFRLWNKLNRPENLIWLCGECHDKKRVKNAELKIEQDGIEQLELWQYI